ncbi:phage tail tube protein [Corynebacterium sp. KPL2825]|uniref:phage tail tube protein n=1 Tax=Corynebacterium sp. KPL2825 TaxID=3135444 RepID=UPI0030C903AD
MANTKFATAPNSCELNKQLNRNWALQVKPVGADPAEYKFVRGVTSLSPNIETSTVDASDIDSNGWTSEEKTSRSLTVSVEGQFARKGDLDLLTEDQQLLKMTGEELGADGKVDFRVWRTDIDEGWEGTATNSFTSGSGGANDLRTFTSDLKSSCEPTRIHSVAKGSERKESEPVDVEELLSVIHPKGVPAEEGSNNESGETDSETGAAGESAGGSEAGVAESEAGSEPGAAA